MVERKVWKDERIGKHGRRVLENVVDENIIVRIVLVFTMDGELVVIIVFYDGYTTIFIRRCLERTIQIIFID